MKKIAIIMTLVLGMVMATTAFSQWQPSPSFGTWEDIFDVDLIMDEEIILAGYDGTTTDSVTVITPRLNMYCDTVDFIYSLYYGEPNTTSTVTDSVSVYARIQYVTPFGKPNWTDWLDMDTVFTSIDLASYPVVMGRCVYPNRGKYLARLHILHENFATVKYVYKFRLWMIRHKRSWRK